MKRIEPIKNPLRGDITVPGDKSIAHRAVIFGSVAHGRSRIFNLSGGDDNSRTVRAFRQMGVEIFRDGDALVRRRQRLGWAPRAGQARSTAATPERPCGFCPGSWRGDPLIVS